MDQQKIFLLIIGACAICILLLQAFQSTGTGYRYPFGPEATYFYYSSCNQTNFGDIHRDNIALFDLLKWKFNQTPAPATGTQPAIGLLGGPSQKLDSISSKYQAGGSRYNRYKSGFSFIEKFPLYLGSNQTRILILAYLRSGSSFLGDLLQHDWKTFYTFEPLHYMTREKRIGHRNFTEATELLTRIYNCNSKNMKFFLNWARRNTFLLRWNRFFWNLCKFRYTSLCYDPSFFSKVCQRSKVNLIKTVRLKMKHVEPLINMMSDQKLKVLYLVRDPRGIYNSRKKMTAWCTTDDCTNLSYICADLREDLEYFDRLKASPWGADIHLVRYEDLAIRPYNETERLFKALGLQMTADVRRFLATHTNVQTNSKLYADRHNTGDPYSTYRANSTMTAMGWTKSLSHSELRYAEKVCRDVLIRLNYTILLDKEQDTIRI